MASTDMAPRCTRCSFLARREVRHWPDTRHYGRIRRAWARLRRRT